MVTTCCGCFPLGFGAIVIMSLTMIASLSMLLSQVSYSSNLSKFGLYYKERDYMSKFFIFVFGAGLLTSVLGIIGLFQMIRSFVLAFYYYLLFKIALYFIALLVLIIDRNFFMNVIWKAMSHEDATRDLNDSNVALSVGITILILLVLTMYSSIVVRSYYWLVGGINAYIRPIPVGIYSKSHDPQPSN